MAETATFRYPTYHSLTVRPFTSSALPGALVNLGHSVARSTIAEILKRHGIEPAPERSRKTTWKEFLTRHWELIVAADFFTVEVWTRRGLERFFVLFFLISRRAESRSLALPPRRIGSGWRKSAGTQPMLWAASSLGSAI